MKYLFKKISAITTSVLLTGMTMGLAAAAAFPTDFASATPAIVYGASADPMDLTQANSINTYLTGKVPGSFGTPTGEGYLFEKDTNKLNINDNLTLVKTVKLTDTELPMILADGTYQNSENDEFAYEQSISVDNNVQFAYWADSDYMSKKPTLGIKIAKNAPVLNYTLDFVKSAEDDSTTSDLLDLENTKISFLGQTYTIVDASNSSNTLLTLMRGSEQDTLGFGESKTYTVDGKTYEVIVTYVDSDECKFTVNGESTNKLTKGQTDKLSDGNQIGVTEVDYSTGAVTEIMNCEFYIGADKIDLEDTKEVEINDVDVDNLYVYIDETESSSPFLLNKIILEWKANEDLFVTETSSVVMPGFGSVKLSYTGLTAPTGETIKFEGKSNDEIELTLPIKSGTTTIQLLASNGTGNFTKIGGSNDGEGLLTNNATNYGASGANPKNLVYDLGSNSTGHQYFVATYWDGSSTGESYLVEISDSDDTNGVDFTDVITGTDLSTGVKNGTAFEIGEASFLLENFIEDEYVKFNATSANTYIDRIITDEGLMVYLPYSNGTASVASPAILEANGGGIGPDAYIVYMQEENKDGVLNSASSQSVNVTLGHTASTNSYNTEAKIATAAEKAFSGVDMLEDPDNENFYTAYTISDLGTYVEYDSNPDEDTVTVTYYGEQVYGNVYISESGSTSSAGSMVFKDSEKTSWNTKNVIIVGGTCINTAAAEALGIAANTCEAAFTSATDVGSGQYLIQTVGSYPASGKIALVVAGYEKADTAAAANRLVNKASDIQTTAGTKYIGVASAGLDSVLTKVA